MTEVDKKARGKKRRSVFWMVMATATGTGTASAAPTTGLEAPKQVAIAGADVILMSKIYTTYFDETLDDDRITAMLKEAGLFLTLGVGVAYGGVKATEALLGEVLNFVPVVGWALSGAITGSVTLTVGALWWWACDSAYSRGTSPVVVLRQALA